MVGDAHQYDIEPLLGWVLVIGGFEVIEEMKLLKSKGVGENDFYWKFQLTRRNEWNNEEIAPVREITFKFCNFVSMKTGTTIIAHPSTSEQVAALKAFVKALKIKFEVKTQNETYDPAFVEKVLQGDKDFESGNFKVLKTEDLWK